MASLACCLRTPLVASRAACVTLLRQAPACAPARCQSALVRPKDSSVKTQLNPECFLCGDSGHLARACPKEHSPMNRDNWVTFEHPCKCCGELGHLASDCLNDPHDKAVLYCSYCDKHGHITHQCPDIFTINSPGNTGVNLIRCELCAMPGHTQKDCTHRKTLFGCQ